MEAQTRKEEMKHTTILVYICSYLRPFVTALSFAYLQRLIYYKPEEYTFIPFVCGSTRIDNEVARSFGYDCLQALNSPLGRKHNVGLHYAINKYYNVDYVMTMGSDDIILPELLDKYERYFNEGVEVFGPSQCYFFDFANESMKKIQMPKTFGAGRCYRADLIQEMYAENYALWDDTINRGLDNNSAWRILRRYGAECRERVVNLNHPHVLDLKSRQNVNTIETIEAAEEVNSLEYHKVINMFFKL